MTALAIATDNIFADRDYLKTTLENVLSPLTSLPQPSSEPLDPTALPLTQFVILLSEIAKKKGEADLSVHLHEWLNNLLAGTDFDWLAVAGRTVTLPKECVWAPAVEIAWNPTTLSRFPEVYIRWAGLRQRIEVPQSTNSRRVQATNACDLIENDPRYSRIDVDHVEVSVNEESIAIPWELKNESSVDAQTPERFKWPVTVRLCKSCGPVAKADHDGRVLDQATIRSSLNEDELVEISITDGFFIALEHVEGDPSTAFFVAAKTVSAAIWSRSRIDPQHHQLITKILHGKTLYDLPSVIHRPRSICSRSSIWRQAVLFWDPNLPEFEFSITNDDTDSELIMTFLEINEAL
jgi:hypothetical protein